MGKYFFGGLMDEMSIFPSALDDQTIAGIFGAVQPDTFDPANGFVAC